MGGCFRSSKLRFLAHAAGLLALAFGASATAAQGLSRSGKLLLTGGVSSVDGAAGGGLTPWAVIGSYATEGQFGASAFATGLKTSDYSLIDIGVAASYGERIELSVARQDLDTKNSIAPLGFPGLRLKQTIVGVKVRVAGDAVLDSDSLMPAIAVGVLHKKLDTLDSFKGVLTSLGAKDSGTDIYLSATKLFLAQSTLVNLTLRATKANQNGLLGFGSSHRDSYRLQPEVSVAYLLSKNLAIGAEYRAKPDNLNPSPFGDGLKEDDWKDLFVAWAPTKNVSLTVAYVDLGKIVPALVPKRQRGGYVSAQLGF
jgi:Protein of unknown function (DUF3034)